MPRCPSIRRALAAAAAATAPAAAAALLLLPQAAAAPRVIPAPSLPGRACAPITVWTAGSGADRYDVRLEEGSAGCAQARSVLRGFTRDAVLRRAGGWLCFRGHSGDDWAAACTRGDTIARTYGPLPEQDLWRTAAARLGIPLFAPTVLPVHAKVDLQWLDDRSCGSRYRAVTAAYGPGAGPSVFLVEAVPEVCGDVGDATLLGHRSVRGRPATLFRVGPGAYLLSWTERGTQIGLQTTRLSLRQLLQVAAGLRLVDV